MAKPNPAAELQSYYVCGSCSAVLEEGETRCGDCNLFASKVLGIRCPHCDEIITEDQL